MDSYNPTHLYNLQYNLHLAFYLFFITYFLLLTCHKLFLCDKSSLIQTALNHVDCKILLELFDLVELAVGYD